MQTASLNPFENNNGKFFDASGGYDGTLNNADYKERDNYSPSLSDDPKHDMVDIRRKVVYLQVLSTRSLFFILLLFSVCILIFNLSFQFQSIVSLNLTVQQRNFICICSPFTTFFLIEPIPKKMKKNK